MTGSGNRRSFQAAREDVYDRVIVGGGMAALFSAYETLKEARVTGKTLSLVVITDRLSAPSPAGSQFVMGVDGQFVADVPDSAALTAKMRESIADLEQTIKREGIDCGFARGYEIKGADQAMIAKLVSDVLEKGIYKESDIIPNTDTQAFHFPGYPESIKLDLIGQVNIPDLLNGLVNAIAKMGGKILTGRRYESQTKGADGNYTIETSQGSIVTRNKPLLATGAQHQISLPDFPVGAKIVHTMSLMFGPIDEADLIKYTGTSKPIAFCDSNLEGDVLWGGIDDKRRLTVGRGDLLDPADKDDLQADFIKQMETLYPGLTTKYPPLVTFGPMMVAENMMPVVGRLKDYDLMGGWYGRGIVPGYMAAKAYAQMAVHDNDRDMRLMERMQPGAFTGENPANTAKKVIRPD